jgi:ABC-2 type transport system permease protein
MTTIATSPTTAVTIARSPLTGLSRMVLFVARRNWLRLLIWTVVIAGMIVLVVQSQRAAFPTQADREAYAQIANTPAVAAMTGLPYSAATLGGILMIKIWMTNAIALSFAAIFLITRNGRAEEESGRTELLRAGVLGRHAYTIANWLVVAVFTVVVGLFCALGAISQGLPVDGSLAMGASFTAVALVFIGVAAIAGQLSQTGRGANTISAVVLAVAYLVRAAADLAAEGETASPIAWASPIGWGQQMRAYGDNNWWPFALAVGVAIILCAIALAIERRRDVGAGLLPDRRGPRTASALTRTPIGLVVRLQRAPIIGWTIGIVVGALFFGTVATAMAELLANGNPLADAFIGKGADVLDGLLGFFAMANALLVAAFALQSADAIRADEMGGRTELQWTGIISRVHWALARIIVPAVLSFVLLAVSGAVLGASFGASVNDPSQVGRFTAASVAYWPAILLVIGFVVLCAGWIPRWAGAVSWAAYGVAVLISMFGGIFGLPDWVVNNTPFTAVPRVPNDPTAIPLFVLGIIAVTVTVAGLYRLRSRDMASA